ncbi:Tri-functionnal domain DHFR/deoxycytidylate deaminase/Riboflavin biosynthesis protein RibD [Orpheovirus IHUMI-LCC2]|uniref:5-amino-6-(5-phosphoribosylamino)uracil reductase n=1 Tax=Orpheovirus IHUMI-LCC2 TaxID=2023057 RepID=A0A2I2L4R9_9VIRU|nr:Tri-functionnal domain DHFR/deoxycytidylate deaminase/Riboflavin biosynthesis protein RibD [Orpheovirus IHUMI-LCC2]SNW62500.1 Tri-functionnal domain DHFR/deoxycytidylate deaminase/Riboflavin biosynthesis protein RibD [Orpheovirus IHUMI-LCC2]
MVFTGLVQETGIAYFQDNTLHVKVNTKYWKDCKVGDSIAINGVCLTLLKSVTDDVATFFVMEETKNKTTFNSKWWEDNIVVNVEKSMKLGDNVGGHIVSGHVHQLSTILDIKENDDGSKCLWIGLEDASLVKYKGSISVDGVSLTVAEVLDTSFRVSLIPHTLSHTNLQYKIVGSKVNLEFDNITKQKTNEENDVKYMKLAVEIGEKGMKTCGPNPWVGCVIVDSYGEVIGTGYHQVCGQSHAEVLSLQEVKDKGLEHKLQGACLYTTLEPCHRYEGKRTGPCDELIVSTGIKRVVIAIVDEDKNVGGNGIKYLRDNGIEVIVGVCQEEARRSLLPYLHHRKTGRPLVVCKVAMSIDGKIGLANGNSQWITNEDCRKDGHRRFRGMLGRSGVVLVGAQTVINDNPKLTVRVGNDVVQPRKVILDGRGRVIDTNLYLLNNQDVVKNRLDDWDILVATTNVAEDETVNVWNNLGMKVWKDNNGDKGKVRLNKLLDELGAMGIMYVLVEGGSNVTSQFLSEGLFDILVVYIGNCLVGLDGMGWGPNRSYDFMDHIKRLKLVGNTTIDSDVCLTYHNMTV